MKKTKKFFLLFFLLLFFSTYFPNQNNVSSSFLFPIDSIKIENTKIIETNVLKNKLEFLKGKSLFFINKETVKDAILKFDFISNFQIKKIYPKTIKIIITEKKPVAIYTDREKKFYLTNQGDLINFISLENYNDLPFVFGKKFNFKKIFKELKNINFPMNQIKSLHYFEIGRWDITLKNDKIIKLPKENYVKILKSFISLNQDKKFDQYKIFDYRINNQLILN